MIGCKLFWQNYRTLEKLPTAVSSNLCIYQYLLLVLTHSRMRGRGDWCMKIDLHPQLNKNPAITLPGVRPLGTLFVFLFVSSSPAFAFPLQETTTPRTFADWCLNKNKESVQIKHTVDVLLQVAKTTDCHQAGKLLSTRSELYLNNNQITDLKPLSSLTNLAFLNLGNNQIADLKPLSTLTNLTGLTLYNNQIADLKPLSSLTNLTSLSLYNNQIASLRPLSTLTKLTILLLENNQIADLKPLSTLTNLTRLLLNNNQITDLKPLSTLTKLTGLLLAKNQIADLKPLSTLTNLTTLDLNNNQITGLQPLSTLTNLKRLDLNNNQTLTDKTCPVKPASVCRFAPFQAG
jgi:internalin A